MQLDDWDHLNQFLAVLYGKSNNISLISVIYQQDNVLVLTNLTLTNITSNKNLSGC